MTTTAASPRARFHPSALLAWTLCGVLFALAFAGMLTIGAFVLPLALLLAGALLARHVPHTGAGLLIGAGLLLSWVAWNLRWQTAATCSGASYSPAGATTDPCARLVVSWGWLIPALVLLAAGAALTVRDARSIRE